MAESKSDILQGTLDLMVLKTLDAMGPMHGYGIARRIEQISEEALQVNQGTIYLCLIRLVQKGWITAEWGTSENNRKAKFYSISKAGRKQLAAEARNWERVSGVIGTVAAARREEGMMMAALRRIGARVAAFFTGRALDRDFEQELASHLAMQTDEQHPPRHDAGAGAPRGAASAWAARSPLQQQHREVRGLPALESIVQDLRFAFRLIAKEPLVLGRGDCRAWRWASAPTRPASRS